MALVQGLVSLIRWTVSMARSDAPIENASVARGHEADQALLDAAKKLIRDYATSVRRFPQLHPECPPRFLSMVDRLDTLASDEVFDLAQHVGNVFDA